MNKLKYIFASFISLFCAITAFGADIPASGYLINVCGLHIGYNSWNNAALRSADNPQKMSFNNVGNGVYTITCDGKYLSKSGDWSLVYADSDRGNASRFTFEQDYDFLKIKCVENGKYLGPDGTDAGADVFSDKSGNRALDLWYIATDPSVAPPMQNIRYAVSPANVRQEFEGWGFTLCWWANVIGKWDDKKIDEMVSWLVDDLGVRIFRYNIPGGDNCTDHHMANTDSSPKGLRAEMEGFVTNWDDYIANRYNWNADAAQIKILRKIHEKCPDAIFEAFANSAPWFMTKSQCAAGGDRYSGWDGGPAENLDPDMYKHHCWYMINVMKHIRDTYGIEFRTLSPINEPRGWTWHYKGGQEGCRFTDQSLQEYLKVLEPILAESGLNTKISMSEQSGIAEAKLNLDQFHNAGLDSKVWQWNTHTYSADRLSRTQMGGLARAYGPRMWMSEVCYGSESNADDVALMQNIFDDLRYILSIAWVEWQFVDSFGGENNEHGWGCVGAEFYDGSQYYKRLKRYFLYKQIMTAIRPGDRLITSLNEQSLAALSADGKTLKLVLLNATARPERHWIDLTQFGWVSNNVTSATRTSATENFATVEAPVVNDGSLMAKLPPLSLTTITIDVSGVKHSAGVEDGATYWIIPRNAENMAINYGGANVDIQPVSNDPGQAWTAHAHDDNTFSFSNGNGMYLMAKRDGSYFLEATPVDGQEMQWFHVRYIDGVYNTIDTGVGNKVLDLDNQAFTAGTRVGQWDDSYYPGDTHRHFLLVRQPDGIRENLISFDRHDEVFRAKVGEEHANSFTVTTSHDAEDFNLSIHDDDGVSARQFSIEKGQNNTVTVRYTPTVPGSHWAWVAASLNGARTGYVDVHGDSYAEPTITVSGNTMFATDSDNPVTNTFSINAQGLIGKIYAGTWDADWRLFSVNLPWGSKAYNTISFNNSRTGWDNVYVFLFDPANPDANLLGGNDYVAMTDSGNGIFKFDYPVTRDDLKIRFSEGDKATFTDDVDFIPGAMYYASGRVARRMPHAVPALADVNDSFTVTFTPEQPGQASAQIWIKTDGKPNNENIGITANATTSASDLVDDSGLTVTVLPDAIHVTGNGIKELVLQSVAGAVVAGSDNGTVSTGHLPKGTYLLTIIRTDNGPVTRKISVK